MRNVDKRFDAHCATKSKQKSGSRTNSGGGRNSRLTSNGAEVHAAAGTAATAMPGLDDPDVVLAGHLD